MKKHSTETAAVYLTDNLYFGKYGQQMITGAVFIDLKKDLTWSTMNVCFLS